jgi:hypothetical protein
MATVTGQTITQLTMSVSEKDVENSYRQYFTRKISDMIFTSPFNCDGFGESKSLKIKVLTEFKEELDLLNRLSQIKILSQVVYYLKKFEISGLMLPTTIFIGDKDECFVIHANDVFKYLSMDLDWSIAPSNAYKNTTLINEMMNDENIKPHIFSINNIDDCFNKLKDLTYGVTRLIPITPHNLTEVFSYFEKNVLAKNNLNTNQLANLFTQILINPDDNYLHPVKKRKTIVTKSFNEVPVKTRESFSSFFSHFSNEYTPRQKEDLTAVVDRLIQDVTRRKQGEFFTPTIWVDKAHEYIASVYGEDWKEKYVVWDPAWGTGNLTRDYKFKELYVSTLNYSDIQTADQMGYNPEAVKFQFDFLNDDYDFLPKGLRDAIEGGKEIIVLMNSPYTDGSELTTNEGESKIKGNIQTLVNLDMKNNKIGKCSKQLYAQFLYKTINLIKKPKICVFSPSLFLSGESYDVFENVVLNGLEMKKGFLFAGTNFSDTSGDWPILFSIWDNGENKNKKVDLLSYEEFQINKIGEKIIYRPLNRLIKNPTIFSDDDHIGNCSFQGNTVSGNNQFVSLLPINKILKGKGNIKMTKQNFIFSCTFFSVRRLISGKYCSWTNYYDEYMTPNEQHPQFKKFTYDSIIYSLFDSKSNQSSLRQVTYKDQLWDIKNEFFWMSKEEMMNLSNDSNYTELYNDARTDDNRYVYNLLFGKQNIYEQLSPDAKLVLDKATDLTRMSMTMRSYFADDQNHLNSWDAGYAQLKLVWKEYFTEEFKEFRQLYKNLEDRMRPLIYELGFLLK